MYENANIETIARGVFIREGRLLVCLPKQGGRCYLPGGHIEFWERGREALVREIQEELGVTAEVGRLLAISEDAFDQAGEPHCEINLVYEMTIPILGDEPAAQEDWIAFRWVPCTEMALRKANLLPAHLIKELTHLSLPAELGEWPLPDNA